MTTVAETISAISREHLTTGNGLLLGQCLTAVGWVGGTVPDCEGLVELPMTDVAGSGFAVGCALMGRRPIFVVRYQGFMWYNCSSIINYAARSQEVWGVPCPVFVRAVGMEGNGIGHTASSCLHSVFMHVPGLAVAAPMTPLEYRAVWDYFIKHDDPIYVSEHRRSFTSSIEIPDRELQNSAITVIPISAARLNWLEAEKELNRAGIKADTFNLFWLKPRIYKDELLASLKRTGVGLVIDSDFELVGAAESIAYDLMLKTGAKVFALGLEDRVCGVAKQHENITPSPEKIVSKVRDLLRI